MSINSTLAKISDLSAEDWSKVTAEDIERYRSTLKSSFFYQRSYDIQTFCIFAGILLGLSLTALGLYANGFSVLWNKASAQSVVLWACAAAGGGVLGGFMGGSFLFPLISRFGDDPEAVKNGLFALSSLKARPRWGIEAFELAESNIFVKAYANRVAAQGRELLVQDFRVMDKLWQADVLRQEQEFAENCWSNLHRKSIS